jgi:hypothetical protein
MLILNANIYRAYKDILSKKKSNHKKSFFSDKDKKLFNKKYYNDCYKYATAINAIVNHFFEPLILLFISLYVIDFSITIHKDRHRILFFFDNIQTIFSYIIIVCA